MNSSINTSIINLTPVGIIKLHFVQWKWTYLIISMNIKLEIQTNTGLTFHNCNVVCDTMATDPMMAKGHVMDEEGALHWTRREDYDTNYITGAPWDIPRHLQQSCDPSLSSSQLPVEVWCYHTQHRSCKKWVQYLSKCLIYFHRLDDWEHSR